MKFSLTTVLLFAATASLLAQTPSPLQVELTTFTTGTTDPVGVYHAGDNRVFIVEQNQADIEIYDVNGTYIGKFIDLSSVVNTSGNERGLLGMAFHPDYANNGKFYVNYTSGSSPGSTHISEYTVSADPDVADPLSEVVLLNIVQDFSNHNGGHIAFGPDGYLYIGMGDGGSGGDPNNRAQSGTSLLGKMLRINVSGNGTYTIPSSNPFVGNASYLDQIWAIGVRNPWQFSFDKTTGDLWIADVGQNLWEEIDFQPASSLGGENYGWRCYEADHAFDTGGCSGIGAYDFPIAEFSHSSPDSYCSITGGSVYRGATYEAMVGHYFFTDYCAGGIKSIVPDGLGGWIVSDVNTVGNFGYSAFGEDVDGELYLCDISADRVYKLVDPCDDFQPTIALNDDEVTCSEGTDFWWYLNGNIVAGENLQTHTPLSSGLVYCVAEDANGCAKQTNTLNLVANFYGLAGCTYFLANNYDSEATFDDGTCQFNDPCPSDLDYNGLINTSDLLIMLSSFGSGC
jgi:hypothetical protein